MSSDWGRKLTVGELIADEGGSIKTGPFGTALKANEYVSAGVPLISVREIGHGSFHIDSKTPRVSPEIISRLPEYLLENGDIVFARKGGIERCSLVRKAQQGWFLGSDGIRLRPPKSCDARFLAYALQTQSVKDWLTQHSTGSTMASLNQSIIARLPIRIPPIGEQAKIANCLEALDDRITLLRETNATLEAIAQALFKSWFVDFDPVRANAGLFPSPSGRVGGGECKQASNPHPNPLPQGEEAVPPAEIAALFPDDFEESELGLVPKGWHWSTLADAYEINPQRKLKKGELASYLDMASVPTRGHCAESIIQREMGSGSKFINGDTLLARITPCLENGKSGFVDFLADNEIGWGSTEFLVLRPKQPLPEYHAYLLCRHQAFRDFAIQSISGTSGRQRIQNDVLGRYLLALPTESVARSFGNIVTPIQQRITANHSQAQTLTTLRDTLLPRLISGQLRLPEAGAILEG